MSKQSLCDDLRSIAASDLLIEPAAQFKQSEQRALAQAHDTIIEASDRIEELEAITAGLQAVIHEPIPKDI